MSFLSGNDAVLQVLSLASYGFFIVLIFYGQRIQMYVMIREVENSLQKLKFIKEERTKKRHRRHKRNRQTNIDPPPALTVTWIISRLVHKVWIPQAWFTNLIIFLM